MFDRLFNVFSAEADFLSAKVDARRRLWRSRLFGEFKALLVAVLLLGAVAAVLGNFAVLSIVAKPRHL